MIGREWLDALNKRAHTSFNYDSMLERRWYCEAHCMCAGCTTKWNLRKLAFDKSLVCAECKCALEDAAWCGVL